MVRRRGKTQCSVGGEHYVVERSAHTASKREARAIEAAHRLAIYKGSVHPRDPWPPAPPREAPTLKDFAARFLQYVRLHTKASTAVSYDVCLRRVLPFHPLSEISMDKVTGEVVGKYVRFRQSLAPGNSVATLNGEMRTLRRAFRLAEEWGLILKAPVIHELPGRATRERVITFEEEQRYLAAASGTLRDMAILAADTGMRPDSELFEIQWNNVHLEPSPECPHGYIHVPGGKTKAARRNIPFTARARDVLEARRLANRARSVVLINAGWVFASYGKTGHIVRIYNAHAKAMKRAGLKPFEFYCWRHTCGTRWAESGMDRFSVARLMGHSSPAIAEKYYIHVTEPHVAAGFERFLGYIERKLAERVTVGVTAGN